MMKQRLRDNSLGLTMFGLSALFLLLQSITGFHSYNSDQREHGEAAIQYSAYLRNAHFVEATFENWESEFLQMSFYVFLTAFLYQRGSSESKDPEGEEGADEEPRLHRADPDAPWPVRRGGVWLTLYRRSLSGTLFLLFVGAFALHAWGGAHRYSQEQMAHGGAGISIWSYLTTSQFWFESFQNWQSEFLAVFTLATLSIFLRDFGSPESKPVAAAHSQTGE